MSENYHLTYNAENQQWTVKKEGGSRPSDQFESHSKALKRARELARNSSVNLILHDEDGKITGTETAEDLESTVMSRLADKAEGAIKTVTGALKR